MTGGDNDASLGTNAKIAKEDDLTLALRPTSRSYERDQILELLDLTKKRPDPKRYRYDGQLYLAIGRTPNATRCSEVQSGDTLLAIDFAMESGSRITVDSETCTHGRRPNRFRSNRIPTRGNGQARKGNII